MKKIGLDHRNTTDLENVLSEILQFINMLTMYYFFSHVSEKMVGLYFPLFCQDKKYMLSNRITFCPVK